MGGSDVVTDHCAAFHHEGDVLQDVNVGQRIALDSDDVSEFACLHAADLIGQPLRATTIGTLAVAGAAASYAVAALVQRRRLRGVSPLQVGFWQLALATPLALAAALPSIGATHLQSASIAAIIVLGVGGSGIAYLLYYFMMNTLGGTRATTVTFLLPVTAVFWGASLLHEAITIPILAGMAVILLGVFLTSRPRKPRAPALSEDRGVA